MIQQCANVHCNTHVHVSLCVHLCVFSPYPQDTLVCMLVSIQALVCQCVWVCVLMHLICPLFQYAANVSERESVFTFGLAAYIFMVHLYILPLTIFFKLMQYASVKISP